VTATRRKGLLITAHLPPFCADVVWIPMKVKATQIRLIGAGRAARHVRLATRPEGLLWAWWGRTAARGTRVESAAIAC
jgi:hypothetical protein